MIVIMFLGLTNPGSSGNPVGFGRTTTWDAAPSVTPNPIDNFQYLSHYRNTGLLKKITNANIRRVVRKVQWTANTRYDMFRHDYSAINLSPIHSLLDFMIRTITSLIVILEFIFARKWFFGNKSSGNTSKDEPTFTDLNHRRLELVVWICLEVFVYRCS